MLNLTPAPPPDNIPEGTVFGTFTVRLAAALVDLLVLAPVSFLAYYYTVHQPALYAVLSLGLVQAVYKPTLEKVWGYTVGKYFLKLRVVSAADFGPISWNQTLIRWLPWAIAFYASVFTTIRAFQDPNFGGFADYQEYFDYVRDSPLGQSTILALLNNAPVMSAVFIVGDPLMRALHDRWAGTYVIRTSAEE